MGQDRALSLIENGIKTDHLSQSLIFYGRESIGKMTTALTLAKAYNCENKTDDACNQCKSCRKINAFLHPDVYIINTDSLERKLILTYELFSKGQTTKQLDQLLFYISDVYYRFSSNFFALKGASKLGKKALEEMRNQVNEDRRLFRELRELKSLKEKELKAIRKVVENALKTISFLTLDNIPVESVRQFTQKLYIKPLEGRKKIFIIKGMENMREEAANTFLKSIEEPPPNNVIILLTEALDSLLPTIKSRCFQIGFQPLNYERQQLILDQSLDFFLTENKDAPYSLWDHLDKEKSLNKIDDQVNFFLNDISINYRKQNRLIPFVDIIVQNKEEKAFLERLFNQIRIIKQMKYGAIDKESDWSYIYQQADIVLNSWVKEGEELLKRMEVFHLNPSLTLTAYLMKLSKLLSRSKR